MNEAEVTASERPKSKRPPKKSSPAKSSKSQPNPDLKAQVPFPGIESVMHGNGAVAHVMEHVCDGVIGYPITPPLKFLKFMKPTGPPEESMSGKDVLFSLNRKESIRHKAVRWVRH